MATRVTGLLCNSLFVFWCILFQQCWESMVHASLCLDMAPSLTHRQNDSPQNSLAVTSQLDKTMNHPPPLANLWCLQPDLFYFIFWCIHFYNAGNSYISLYGYMVPSLTHRQKIRLFKRRNWMVRKWDEEKWAKSDNGWLTAMTNFIIVTRTDW